MKTSCGTPVYLGVEVEKASFEIMLLVLGPPIVLPMTFIISPNALDRAAGFDGVEMWTGRP